MADWFGGWRGVIAERENPERGARLKKEGNELNLNMLALGSM
jgi:hypothetical protein